MADTRSSLESVNTHTADAVNIKRRCLFLSHHPCSSGIAATILTNPIGAAIAGISTTSLCAVLWWRYFRRIPNAEYVTPAVLRYRKVLVGRVVTVGDADGFRFHHTPGIPYLRDWFYPWPPKTSRRKGNDGRSKLVRETISVRIAGVDAPESGHFGKPAQPYSKEAKQFLTGMVQSASSPDNLTPPKSSFFSRLHSSSSQTTNNSYPTSSADQMSRLVWLYPSHIDQYKRLVATPYVWDAPYFLGKTNVSLAMVKAGLATVYRSAGADYGHATWWAKVWRKSTTGLNALERAETKARKKKIGMWSLGKKFESPEAYKKRVKGE
uniref:TNase-like domain-containing protein n=1 Tax=Kalmanozyma brasiliensis (strain GHG001) TaxID=1365824 RepID=V5GP51_KALBG